MRSLNDFSLVGRIVYDSSSAHASFQPEGDRFNEAGKVADFGMVLVGVAVRELSIALPLRNLRDFSIARFESGQPILPLWVTQQ